MTVRRGLSLFAPLTLAAFTLAACDGASPAGGDLIGQGGDPVADSLAVTDLSRAEVDDYSGGTALGSSATQGQMLVGQVDDPAFGDVAATAYLDFARPALPEGFGGQTPSAVALILPVGAYAYGDTTASLDVDVRQVTQNWTASADSLDPGQAIAATIGVTSATLAPGDSVHTIDLPSSWISSSDSLLTGDIDSYAERFEGFAITPAAGASGAVRGIDAPNARLRVVVAEDTLFYFANEVYSQIQAEEPPESANMIIRDGSGFGLGVTLPLADPALRDNAISQARLVLQLDTAALQQGGLFRPVPGTFSLLGIQSDGTRTPLANAAVAGGALSFSNATVRSILQQELFRDPSDEPLFERYEIEFLNTTATVNVAPFSRADLRLVRVPPVE